MELSSLSLLCSSLAGAAEGLGGKEGGCQQGTKDKGQRTKDWGVQKEV